MPEQVTVVLGAPGEAELPLLADLGSRDDVDIIAVIDPTGESLGSAIAEIMGLPVTASLADVPLEGDRHIRFVLPSGPGSLVAELSRLAASAGLDTIRTDALRAELSLSRRAEPTPLKPRATLSPEIERESAALQTSLADLENALAGDAILKKLLEFCTASVGASGGSIMLFDKTSRELYIAHAVGLSEGTLHSTRIKLGEGYSGQVAVSRQALLVEGRQGPESRRRDRPDIATAVCAPLCTGDTLLGVLNVSTQTGQAPLDESSRLLIIELSRRLGRILGEVQQLQQQRTSRMFDLTEQQLRRLATDQSDLPETVAAWTATLAVTTEADRVSLVVPCEDGSLLVAEGTPTDGGNHWYEPLHNPAWIEVLGSGLPLVARQDDQTAGDAEPLTVFYLPVGHSPVLGGLAVHFRGSHRAHAFHGLAGETAFLMDRLLPDLLTKFRQTHRGDMLSRVSSAVTELTVRDASPGPLIEDVCVVLGELTGATYSVAIAEFGDDGPRLAGGNAPEGARWLDDAQRLFEAVGDDGWRITTLETGESPASVLVVTSTTENSTPGVLLVGKRRTHALDGEVFTHLDAELASPLVGLLHQFIPAPDDSSDLLMDIMPLGVDIGIRPPGASGHGAREQLIADLERELDRCDRYHNVFGLVIVRPQLPTPAAFDLIERAAMRLADSLRASDRVYTMSDGTLALLVPEDIRHLHQLQQRLQSELRRIADNAELPVPGARAAYPALRGPATAFLEAVLHRFAD